MGTLQGPIHDDMGSSRTIADGLDNLEWGLE